MSELDRQRAQLDELREDLEAHEAKDDDRFAELSRKLDRLIEAVDWLVKAEKDDLV